VPGRALGPALSLANSAAASVLPAKELSHSSEEVETSEEVAQAFGLSCLAGPAGQASQSEYQVAELMPSAPTALPLLGAEVAAAKEPASSAAWFGPGSYQVEEVAVPCTQVEAALMTGLPTAVFARSANRSPWRSRLS